MHCTLYYRSGRERSFSKNNLKRTVFRSDRRIGLEVKSVGQQASGGKELQTGHQLVIVFVKSGNLLKELGMTGTVKRSALRQELTSATARQGLGWLLQSGQDRRLNQRYAADSLPELVMAIPLLRKSRQTHQNRRPDGSPVARVLEKCAKDLNTWAVRCLSMRHTVKKHGLSFSAEIV